MKKTKLSLLAFAASLLSLPAQDAATDPVGVVTRELVPNQFNALGLTLHSSPVFVGPLDSVHSDRVEIQPVDLDEGRTYVLEILSGDASGVIQEIVAWNEGNLFTEDLAAVGVIPGDRVSLRLAPTLDEIFETGEESPLTKSLFPFTADLVWVPNGDGSYAKYFIHSGTDQFRLDSAPNEVAPKRSIVYTDGILIQKRGVASSMKQIGEVKVAGSRILLEQGFNLVSLVAPVGMTLSNSGLSEGLQSALFPFTADLVWVPNGNGDYNRYFVHTSGAWRDESAPSEDIDGPVELPSAVFIQRRASATMVSIRGALESIE